MFTIFLQELRGYLGKGFLLAVFIPTLLFWSAHLVVGLEVTLGLNRAWQRCTNLPGDAKVILILGGLIGLAFSAYLIHNFQLPITRFFEGYWQGWPLLWRLQEPRRHRYLDEWRYLKRRVTELERSVQRARERHPGVQEIALQTELNEVRDRWLMFFPPPGRWIHIRPTRLGNVLRASELYAEDHYGLDAVVLWTRLRPLLQGSIVGTLQDKKIALDFMLLMTAYAGLFTLIWCPILAIFTNRWLLFLLCTTGFPLAWVSYQNAVQNAVAYGEQIKIVFDLHRHELLKALGLKIPVEPDRGRELWQDLSLFFHLNIPPTDVRQYAIPSEEAHKYLDAEISPPEEPKGWTRIGKAFLEFRQGVKEVFESNEGEERR